MAKDAEDRGGRGDLTRHLVLLPRLETEESGDARVAHFVLCSQLMQLGTACPSPHGLTTVPPIAHLSAQAREDLARTCVNETVRSLLAQDGHAPDWITTIHRCGGHPRHAQRASAWTAWLGGDLETLKLLAEQLSTDKQETASLIDGAMLLGLLALEQERIEEAVLHARRAVRMARTEEQLALEYLSAITLARVRRYAGAPYLSTRILRALRPVLPLSFRPWADWELSLSSGTLARGSCLQPWLAVTRTSELEDRVGNTLEQLRPLMPLRNEVAKLAEALSGQGEWAQGQRDFLPLRLGPERAFVLVQPDGRTGRVLACALALHPDAHVLEGQERPRLCLALIALAANGLGPPALFEALYRFAYVPEKHKSILGVLISRASGLLKGVGELKREGGRFQLRVQRTLAILDPRCEPSLEERVLRGISEKQQTAATLATSLAVPLRTVQAALKKLVGEDVCIAEREGRAVRYRVEDTTFHEPTLHRLAPSLKP